jgi:hypothetical protein
MAGAGVMTGTCDLCHEPITGAAEVVEHLRLFHPDEHGDGFQRWPDGEVVVVDMTEPVAPHP